MTYLTEKCLPSLKLSKTGQKFTLTDAAPMLSVSVILGADCISLDGSARAVQLQASPAAIIQLAKLRRAFQRGPTTAAALPCEERDAKGAFGPATICARASLQAARYGWAEIAFKMCHILHLFSGRGPCRISSSTLKSRLSAHWLTHLAHIARSRQA